MGEIESEARKRAGKGKLRKAILETVLTMGEVNMALVCGRYYEVNNLIGEPLYPRRNEMIRRASRHLVSGGYLKRIDGGYELTRKGEAELRSLDIRSASIKRPRKWDKKWRVLIFDIPESRRSLREKIRRSLVSVGFERLQDSVWIFPYDCEELVALLKADLAIGGHLLYMIVDAIEDDHGYRQLFGLPAS